MFHWEAIGTATRCITIVHRLPRAASPIADQACYNRSPPRRRHAHPDQLPDRAAAVHVKSPAGQDFRFRQGNHGRRCRSGRRRARGWRRARRRGIRRWSARGHGRDLRPGEHESSLQPDLQCECAQRAQPREPGCSSRKFEFAEFRSVGSPGGRSVFKRRSQQEDRAAS